jgi:hypothetical protein
MAIIINNNVVNNWTMKIMSIMWKWKMKSQYEIS